MTLLAKHRALVGYTAPFAVFVGAMGLEHALNLPLAVFYPIRVVLTIAAILAFSRPYLAVRPAHVASSAAVGVAVFLVWIAPDVLFHYRNFWLFDNSLAGHPVSTMPAALHTNIPFLVVRTLGATVLVPILEELFWRGWMMRWLINPKFEEVPFGTFVNMSFWVVAALFASEHGSYWEVGLLAGIAYNWWAVRTRNLADCMIAHGVTNAILSAYVMLSGQWQYWS